MRKVLRQIVIGFLLMICVFGCFFSGDDSNTNSIGKSHVDVDLVADRHPPYMETATITCIYSIDYPPDRSETLPFIVNGFIKIPPVFSLESGESIWVDTTSSFNRVKHSIVIKALQLGSFMIDAEVWTHIDSVNSIGDVSTLLLNVQ